MFGKDAAVCSCANAVTFICWSSFFLFVCYWIKFENRYSSVLFDQRIQMRSLIVTDNKAKLFEETQ